MAVDKPITSDPRRHPGDGRICTGCNETKLWSAFSRAAKGYNGYLARCKKCYAEYHQKTRAPKIRKQRLGPAALARIGIQSPSPTREETPFGSALRVSLTRGATTIVDEADWPKLNSYTWYLASNGYVVANIPGAPGKCLYMHRVIMDAPAGVPVDHIDRDRTNNRRSNLRLASASLNNANSAGRLKSKSGFKGVRLLPSGRWTASISVKGRVQRIGTFSTPEIAARAYDAAASKFFGPFAVLNFPT